MMDETEAARRLAAPGTADAAAALEWVRARPGVMLRLLPAVEVAARASWTRLREEIGALVPVVPWLERALPSDAEGRAALLEAIVAAWQTTGGRPLARALLDHHLHGRARPSLHALALLARRPKPKQLRQACEARLAELAVSADDLDALAVDGIEAGDADAKKVAALRIEDAMVAARPMRTRTLLALMVALKKNLALVVETEPNARLLMTITNVPATADVRIVHPIGVAPDERRRWLTQIAALKAQQPVEQMARAIYRVSSNWRDEDRVTVFESSTRRPTYLWKKGWEPIVDDAVASASMKRFFGCAALAVYEHRPIDIRDLADDSDGEEVTEQMSFAHMKLADVPPLALSEALRDVIPAGATPFSAIVCDRVEAPVAAPKRAPKRTAAIDRVEALMQALAVAGASAAPIVNGIDARTREIMNVVADAKSDDEAEARLEMTPERLLEALTGVCDYVEARLPRR